jgi:hypothetical protein
MIDRSVLNDSSRIDRMDIFNDGKDTLQWLRLVSTFGRSKSECERADKAIEKLEKRIEERLGKPRKI